MLVGSQIPMATMADTESTTSKIRQPLERSWANWCIGVFAAAELPLIDRLIALRLFVATARSARLANVGFARIDARRPDGACKNDLIECC